MLYVRYGLEYLERVSQCSRFRNIANCISDGICMYNRKFNICQRCAIALNDLRDSDVRVLLVKHAYLSISFDRQSCLRTLNMHSLAEVL